MPYQPKQLIENVIYTCNRSSSISCQKLNFSGPWVSLELNVGICDNPFSYAYRPVRVRAIEHSYLNPFIDRAN